ncbi:hypothetical protein KC678_00405 [Candidatus Dojkabacteria bacterium]|uniref:Dockerin domain-containing protein n=1 Tax=Candidatus Dojkabacteria bacterium TaxID=2099670 RepID=A0A955I813_9BACT|nr:hypothetical protein [Candidatus Dojkabacteria bacterium]
MKRSALKKGLLTIGLGWLAIAFILLVSQIDSKNKDDDVSVTLSYCTVGSCMDWETAGSYVQGTFCRGGKNTGNDPKDGLPYSNKCYECTASGTFEERDRSMCNHCYAQCLGDEGVKRYENGESCVSGQGSSYGVWTCNAGMWVASVNKCAGQCPGDDINTIYSNGHKCVYNSQCYTCEGGTGTYGGFSVKNGICINDPIGLEPDQPDETIIFENLTCGNRLIDEGEACDTKIEGYRCSSDCKVLCDYGYHYSDEFNRCVTNCGDGIINHIPVYLNYQDPEKSMEVCDYGIPAQSRSCNRSCNFKCEDGYILIDQNTVPTHAQCVLSGCGNTVIEEELGEVCEHYENKENLKCSSDCKIQCGEYQYWSKNTNKCEYYACGNGLVDPGEVCDPNVSGERCSPSCDFECEEGTKWIKDEINSTPTKEVGICLSATCGNGNLESDTEICDYSLIEYGKRCNDTCNVLCSEGQEIVSSNITEVDTVCKASSTGTGGPPIGGGGPFGRSISITSSEIEKQSESGTCLGDFNGDGEVNLIDFNIIAEAFDLALEGDYTKLDLVTDTDSSVLNNSDFGIFTENYFKNLQTCTYKR